MRFPSKEQNSGIKGLEAKERPKGLELGSLDLLLGKALSVFGSKELPWTLREALSGGFAPLRKALFGLQVEGLKVLWVQGEAFMSAELT